MYCISSTLLTSQLDISPFSPVNSELPNVHLIFLTLLTSQFDISTQAKNIQASNILPIIKRVGKEKSNTILLNKEDIENLYSESTVLYSHLKEIKIDHVIYSGLYSDDNRLIGLVALEYHEGYPFHEDLINLFDIRAKTSKISQLLQFDVQAKLNYESK